MRHKINPSTMPGIDKVHAKIALLVQQSPERRILITHLVKLLYALELKSLAERNKRFTDVRFIHDHYGPNAPEVELILKDKALFKQEIENGRIYYSVKTSKKDVVSKISIRDQNFINAFASEFYTYKFSDKADPHNAGGLLGYAYNTLPFIETKFKEEIRFENYFESPMIDKVLIKDKDFARYQEQAIKLSEEISPLFTTAGRDRLNERLRGKKLRHDPR
ncbi:type II toxin-antitoxin system antitoxin SocA domain-containing protein [Leptospira yasudae]|uniref:Antitoxin SocA-like Panacea domain-containing protein n=1 Tax=Leptospira yasudae TaxID=2202201 RepID=A0ABX9LX22_9LEPT|nr:type II toxin-antitoxin system antitoxin SocA domain-containing protein [Leptospira yasudae]RHX77424.1 hypothetical protein DLM77_21205 [Leptospira yasudae]